MSSKLTNFVAVCDIRRLVCCLYASFFGEKQRQSLVYKTEKYQLKQISIQQKKVAKTLTIIIKIVEIVVLVEYNKRKRSYSYGKENWRWILWNG